MTKKNYEDIASKILLLIGGKENISYCTHCVTRLRITTKDKSLIKVDEINKLSGVVGNQWSGEQFQIIIGNEVEDVYKAICKLADIKEEASIDENLDVNVKKEKGIKGIFSTLLEILSSVLAPIIPAIVACGLLQGLLYSAQSLGWIDPANETYTFFFTCSQVAFYFLPILVGYSAGKRFKCNPILAATTAGILMSPSFSALAGTQIKLFGIIPVMYAGYASTVIPAILTVYFQSHVERLCKRFVPKMIDIIVTPLVTVMVSAIVGWTILAPIGGWLGTFVAEGILWLYTSLGPIGGAICGAVYPFMLMTGMQVAMSPITVQNLATLGYDFIYPCTAASNAAMAVCALYIFWKSKDENTKSMGLSTGITGLIGVTEPVFFGLIAKYKKALIATVVGGAAGGLVMGAFTVQYLSFGFVPFGTIVLAMTETFPYYMIGVCIAMVVAFVMMYLLKWKD
ncbi:MAG: PTS transporter subunit EIIC [Anaerorhabdus sp.]|uniref:PTS transporter subunit EIIC n=1 Tax=Anaerorhabdus sp. TaxID=1872524 RepID=UPI002B1EBFFB|nr:PTS transporter subunit EIIC [Anaerorhabdus sp.]MEA4875858.1 PTS transporter subunit EIIC [Anaerorhabdus sp.]